MPRRPAPHWDKRESAYRTEAGGRTHYFRGITRDDSVAIAVAFRDYLAGLDLKARPPAPKVIDLCKAFWRAGRGVKARTARSHEERLLRFCDWPAVGSPDVFGDRPAKSITATDLRRALRAWEAEGLSDHYRAGICRSVKAAWAWAASEDGGRLIPANPLSEVKVPAVGRAPERYVSRSEVAAFLRFCWRRASDHTPTYRRFGRLLCLLMRVAAHTGARPGELCSAWWSDFDPGRGTITLPPDRHKTGKSGRPRVIFLPPALVGALVRERARPGRHPTSIFTHKRGHGAVARGALRLAGEPWGEFVTLPDGTASFAPDSTPLSRAVGTLRKRAAAAGVRVEVTGDNRFVLYRLRHTYISDALMGGVSSVSVAEVAGTSDRMVAQVYGHLLADHVRQTAGEIGRIRRASGAKSCPDE